MDFGMAYQHGDQRLTDAGVVLGTMAYLSPEQARGQATDPRSDVYAVGLMLYEMLTGRRPPGDGIALPLALQRGRREVPAPQPLRARGPRRARRAWSCAAWSASPRGATAPRATWSRPWPTRARRSPRARRRWACRVPSARARGRPSPPRWWPPAGGGGGPRRQRPWARPAAPAAPRSVAVLPLAYDGPKEKAYLKDVLPLVIVRGPARLAAPAGGALRVEPHLRPG